MARDQLAYLASLEKVGYTVRRLNSGRMEVCWKGRRVATGSFTGWQGRGLRNLKSHVKRFERGQARQGEGAVTNG